MAAKQMHERRWHFRKELERQLNKEYLRMSPEAQDGLDDLLCRCEENLPCPLFIRNKALRIFSNRAMHDMCTLYTAISEQPGSSVASIGGDGSGPQSSKQSREHMLLTPCAMQRLQKDIKEIEKEPLPGIQVKLDPDDLSDMCLLLTPLQGKFEGVCLHLSVSIPPSYPHHPPRVTIQSPYITISHFPHIFRSLVFCSILIRDKDDQGLDYYNPGYLLKYLFLQLRDCFSAPTYSNHFLTYGQWNDLGFSCKKCGFDSHATETSSPSHKEDTKKGLCSRSMREDRESGSNIQCIQRRMNDQLKLTEASNGSGRNQYLNMLHDHIWVRIFDRLPYPDLMRLEEALMPRHHVGNILHRYNMLTRQDMLCFFTLKNFEEAVLGVGLSQEKKAPTSKKPPVLHAHSLDLLSQEAFEEQQVRSSMYGHSFSYFLPLSLDDDHFNRSIPALRKFLVDVRLTPDLSPSGYLYVIPKLMNMMILDLMTVCDSHEHEGELILQTAYQKDLGVWDTTCKTGRKGALMLQACERAFKGYCLFFHILVKLCERGFLTEAKANLQKKLALFLSSKRARHKNFFAYLGEFVALLPLVLEEGYDWATLCSALVEELLARSVPWILREAPELEDVSGTYKATVKSDVHNLYKIPTHHRLQATFNASIARLRIVMMQASFMRALMRNRSNLSKSYGFPYDSMAAKLVERANRIYLVGKNGSESTAWRDFFTIMQYNPCPNQCETEEMLRQAIQESERKGYHKSHHRTHICKLNLK